MVISPTDANSIFEVQQSAKDGFSTKKEKLEKIQITPTQSIMKNHLSVEVLGYLSPFQYFFYVLSNQKHSLFVYPSKNNLEFVATLKCSSLIQKI
ncbi:MAG: hypothetical protein D6799_04910 [Bacteroidetes bacterium]|nr:MAG: hypothetical protein D6799_04910 [Bacteroidota bacterium]